MSAYPTLAIEATGLELAVHTASLQEWAADPDNPMVVDAL